MMHEAHTSASELSLHLTLTIPSHDFTWASFGAHAIMQLLMEQTGSLRSMVNADIALGAAGSDKEQAMLQRVLDTAKEGLTLEAAQQYFSTKIMSHNRPQDNVVSTDHFSYHLPRQIARKSQLRIKHGMHFRFEEDNDKRSQLCKMMIHNDGRTLEQAVDRKHVMVYHGIASTKGAAFTVEELPGDGYSQVCVCKLLLRQEVLEILEDPSMYPNQSARNKSLPITGPSSMPAIEEEEEEEELLYSA